MVSVQAAQLQYRKDLEGLYIVKVHLARYWSEWRGRYRFIFSQLRCSGQFHMLDDGLKIARSKRQVTCKRCKKLKVKS